MSGLIALATGFFADLLFGDPQRLPHPVVAIGRFISLLETRLRSYLPPTPRGELAGGTVLVLVVAASVFIFTALLSFFACRIHYGAGLVFESIVCYQALATKSLRAAAIRVYAELSRGDIDGARNAVALIVGRDTQNLDPTAVARATVETVAENASDGVVAPMLYFALGGAPLALLYKAINTMDSMLGYKNARYLFFGRAAARLDDAANYIPARLTALLMLAVAAATGFDGRGAARIYRRDRRNHTSPNAGHPEAAAAGALGIRLGGDSSYGGKLVGKPVIGDGLKEPEADDIRRACRLLDGCALASFLFCGILMTVLTLFREGARGWN